jgi:hypothetical protein
MSEVLEILPNERELTSRLFDTDEAYTEFREWYIDKVEGEMERLSEARRKSEEEARQRLLR